MDQEKGGEKGRGKERQGVWWTLPALPFDFTLKYGILSRHSSRIIESRRSGKLILGEGRRGVTERACKFKLN